MLRVEESHKSPTFLQVEMLNLLHAPPVPSVFLLLSLLLLPALCSSGPIITGSIDAGFNASAMGYVDNDGRFLESPNGTFYLAFSSSSSSSYSGSGGGSVYYLSVFLASPQTVVWTANRDHPVSTSGTLAFGLDGSLVLTYSDANAEEVWSVNTSGRIATRMQLSESGNLALLDQSGDAVWQSFNHPTDTLLTGQSLTPGMKLSSANYSLSFELGDLRLYLDYDPPQLYWSMVEDPVTTPTTVGTAVGARLDTHSFELFSAEGKHIYEITFTGTQSDPPPIRRVFLNHDGSLLLQTLAGGSWSSPIPLRTSVNPCLLPLKCGPYGICTNSGQCQCPKGLSLINIEDVSQGCLPPPGIPTCNFSSSLPSSSATAVQFQSLGQNLSYFASRFAGVGVTVTGFAACQTLCRNDCSCAAFFFYPTQNRCLTLTQVGTILNQGASSSTSGNTTAYIKVNGLLSQQPSPALLEEEVDAVTDGQLQYVVPVIVAGTAAIVIGMVCAFVWWYCRIRGQHSDGTGGDPADDDIFLDCIPGLPARFMYRELQEATDDFRKKLGTGGFGSVYEGVLADGTKVAVKQLESVGQGKKEFRAEVAIIGGIHHIHLVRLRGFCAEGTHRLLVYEFMANGSLDKCLFSSEPTRNRKTLSWETRYNIALGTAKGLAYLHDDCRERIIHCDIKPENILLDGNHLAKVSDFGLAKLMNKEQSQVFTTMRGTRGYLAPEWLMNLSISEKSDVYSYGMVLLEIIGGRKNFNPLEVPDKWYFPAYVAQHLEGGGAAEEVVDSTIRATSNADQASTLVAVALWCIQDEPQARPSMSRVVQVLEGNVPAPDPPLTLQFAQRLHSLMIGAANASEQVSIPSDYNSQDLLSAVQLSAAR